jgi:hypothetical protein
LETKSANDILRDKNQALFCLWSLPTQEILTFPQKLIFKAPRVVIDSARLKKYQEYCRFRHNSVIDEILLKVKI